MRKFALLFIMIFIVGCGYQPAARAVDNILDDNIFVEVSMSATDPQNTVAIKDAVRSGIVKRLGKNLSPKASADTFINASISSINFEAVSYDQLGYITSYRIKLGVNFKTKLKDGTIFSKTTSGDHTFRVSRRIKSTRDISSIISDSDRYYAILDASNQAFDEFIAALSVRAYGKGK